MISCVQPRSNEGTGATREVGKHGKAYHVKSDTYWQRGDDDCFQAGPKDLC